MDSGSAVPTLKPGLSATVAEKLLMDASVRGGGAGEGFASSGRELASGGTLAAELRRVRNARFLAALRLGSNMAASTATMLMATNNSIRVKARGRGIVIWHLAGFIRERGEHRLCQGEFPRKMACFQ